MSREKDYVKKLVDIYLDMKNSQSADAGWIGMGAMEQMFNAGSGSGETHTHDAALFQAGMLKKPHKLFPLAEKALLSLDPKYYAAVICDRGARNRTTMVKGREVKWSAFTIAHFLGINPSTYSRRVKRAYELLIEYVYPQQIA